MVTRRTALAALVVTAAAGPLVPFASAVVGNPRADAIAAVIDADPCLAFVTAWNASYAAVGAAPKGTADAVHAKLCVPFEDAAFNGNVPAATTAAGAAAALHRAIKFEDLEPQDEALVRAALAFLEKEAAR